MNAIVLSTHTRSPASPTKTMSIPMRIGGSTTPQIEATTVPKIREWPADFALTQQNTNATTLAITRVNGIKGCAVTFGFLRRLTMD